MVNFRCFLALALISLTTLVTASDNESLNVTGVYGLDTNPHNLSDSLSPVEQEFAAVDLKFRTNFYKTIYITAKAGKTQYFDDARGDEFNGSASLALKSKFKIFKRKFRYKLGAVYRTKDKTYVSKATGLVATFGGLSIADRYDSESTNYVAELSYKPYKSLKFEFAYQGREKEYEEFAIDRLSNLNYDQVKYKLGMEYTASKMGRFYMNGALQQREYQDRRGKDLDGDNVLGTDLIYDYKTLNIGYIYRPSKKIRFKYTYNYEERRDNVSGYYNATSGYLSMSGKYQIGDYHFIRARLKYSKFSLINQRDAVVDTLEEDASEKQGGSIMLGYEWVVATLFDTKFAVYLEVEHSDFVNTNAIYAYERSQASAGLRWSAF